MQNGVQDGVINMSDIINLAKSFNLSIGYNGFDEKCDLNMDNVVNMNDIVIIAKHFNTSTKDYPDVKGEVTTTATPTYPGTYTPTSTSAITPTVTPTPTTALYVKTTKKDGSAALTITSNLPNQAVYLTYYGGNISRIVPGPSSPEIIEQSLAGYTDANGTLEVTTLKYSKNVSIESAIGKVKSNPVLMSHSSIEIIKNPNNNFELFLFTDIPGAPITISYYEGIGGEIVVGPLERRVINTHSAGSTDVFGFAKVNIYANDYVNYQLQAKVNNTLSNILPTQYADTSKLTFNANKDLIVTSAFANAPVTVYYSSISDTSSTPKWNSVNGTTSAFGALIIPNSAQFDNCRIYAQFGNTRSTNMFYNK